MIRTADIVIINSFDTYEHRVELLKQFFLKQGFSTRVITSDWQHFQKQERRCCPEDYEMIHVHPYMKNFSLDRLRSHYFFSKAAFRRAQELKPKLLWVMVPPNALVKYADRYKREHSDVKLVFDLIDMWPETMPISKFKSLPPFLLWRNLRNKNLGSADAVVTECALYQSVLGKVCDDQKMHTLYLARERTQPEPVVSLPQDRIGLCYLGSINNIIDIACVGKIIEQIKGKVDLHILGDGEKRQELIDTATAAGANVIYHGKVYDSRLKQEIFDQCHYGLNIMKPSVFVGLTMKSMDYFEGGLPIINTIRGDTWNFVEKEKIGINYQDAQSLTPQALEAGQQRRDCIHDFFDDHFSVAEFEKGVRTILDDVELCGK